MIIMVVIPIICGLLLVILATCIACCICRRIKNSESCLGTVVTILFAFFGVFGLCATLSKLDMLLSEKEALWWVLWLCDAYSRPESSRRFRNGATAHNAGWRYRPNRSLPRRSAVPPDVPRDVCTCGRVCASDAACVTSNACRDVINNYLITTLIWPQTLSFCLHWAVILPWPKQSQVEHINQAIVPCI